MSNDDPVVLAPLGYNDLTPWETTVFHEEAKISLNDFVHVNNLLRAAQEADHTDVDFGDVPLERVALCLIAAAARRHTGNDEMTLREAGSGKYVFAKRLAAEDDPKETQPAERSPVE